MSKHLLLIAVGPVQDFIAQARRSRDLWFGSHLLSELSREVASALSGGGLHYERLIFPAFEDEETARHELRFCEYPIRKSDNTPPQNIANKIMALLEEGVDPETEAKKARQAFQLRWCRIASELRESPGRRSLLANAALEGEGQPSAFDEQLDSLLEFTAVWTAVAEDESDYNAARNLLEQEMGARKNLRDFTSWENQRGSVPKSSFDGARETVLREPPRNPSEGYQQSRRRFRMGLGEQLDAVGFVKRTGGEPGQFVPIANIALAPWIAQAEERCARDLQFLREACQREGQHPEGYNFGGVDRRDLEWTRTFPYDGQLFLEGRWNSLMVEARGLDSHATTQEQRQELQRQRRDAQLWARENIRPVLNQLPEPHPYVACLVADGDRMGAALDRLTTRTEHQRFSRELSNFAVEAREVVQQQHRGVLIYAGGDDVLAFVALPDALACAEALKEAFLTSMRKALPDFEEDNLPTLSVGLGAGHVLDSMGHLLTLGRQAEKQAKGKEMAGLGLDRNALGVVVDYRSGGQHHWRERWEQDPVVQLKTAVSLYSGEHEYGRFPARKVFELRDSFRRLPLPVDLSGQSEQEASFNELLILEAERILERAASEQSEPWTPERVEMRLSREEGYEANHRAFQEWLQRMLVARMFASSQLSLSRDDGRTPGVEEGNPQEVNHV